MLQLKRTPVHVALMLSVTFPSAARDFAERYERLASEERTLADAESWPRAD